jgi:hypothetical protein
VTNQVGVSVEIKGHEKTKANCDSRRRRPLPALRRADAVRELDGIGDQRFFYTRWFCCMNKQCKTTLVMPERYKVANPVV